MQNADSLLNNEALKYGKQILIIKKLIVLV